MKLTAALMELHDENPFKLRSYTTAAFNLEKFQTPLELLPHDELEKIEGVGKSMANHIREIVDRGVYGKLDELLRETPKGVIELLDLQGFGAKKIRALWLELGIKDEAELMQACREGRVAELKGFGQKSQDALIEAIVFLRKNRGKLLYAKAAEVYKELSDLITGLAYLMEPVGELRRRCEVINEIEVLVVSKVSTAILTALKKAENFHYEAQISGPKTWKGVYRPTESRIKIHFSSDERFTSDLLLLTGSTLHLKNLITQDINLGELLRKESFKSEEEAYSKIGLPYIVPELREGIFEVKDAREGKLPNLIEESDLKGILHNHSTYSDGRHTLEDMATYCKELGYEYLGITDHSKSAFFAKGMSEEEVEAQHKEIDQLNQKLAPFKIFKGIESDILFDGSLDYPDEVLDTFDFVIASVHMIMNMDEKKATERIITAVSNPYTTILGHPTGRLLLEREGYPLDHVAVVDACAKHQVGIEINANPHRLDLDWRWVQYAIEKGVMLSINPDAHRKSGYHDMHYGLLAARKGGLTKKMNLNSLDVKEIGEYFLNKKPKPVATA